MRKNIPKYFILDVGCEYHKWSDDMTRMEKNIKFLDKMIMIVLK